VDAGDHTAPEHGPNGEERHRVTVAEAAMLLGITAEAVRTRIKRGKLDAVKEPDRPGGTVYVLLPLDLTGPNADPTVEGQDQTDDQTHPDELVSTLREQIAYLQGVIGTRDRELATRAEEIRRRDNALEREQQLTAMFAERLRALEAPESPEPRPDTPGPPDAGGEAQEAIQHPDSEAEARESPDDTPERPVHAAQPAAQVAQAGPGGRREEDERERDEGDEVERRSREGSTEPRERAGRPYWWLIAILALMLAVAVAVMAFFAVRQVLLA
jgi:hypothetical protein